MTTLRAERLSIAPGRAARAAVRELDLELAPGRAVAVVGPSGCGKSTLARAFVGLEPRMTGSLRWGERELVGAVSEVWRAARREIALCWQDASTALDPRQSVRTAIEEARQLTGRPALSSSELDALLARARFPVALRDRTPGQLSGGQRQRAAIARALAGEPRLLIADEVTSAVDRAIAVELRDELVSLPRDGLSLLLITHDLSLLDVGIDEVVVLDEGKVVERGEPAAVLGAPRHALTRALLHAIPRARRPGPGEPQ